MTDKNNKKEGFVLPDGYFNDLEQSVLSKMDNINNNGFKMPEVYFDDMQEQARKNWERRAKRMGIELQQQKPEED